MRAADAAGRRRGVARAGDPASSSAPLVGDRASSSAAIVGDRASSSAAIVGDRADSARRCSIVGADGLACARPVDAGTPLNLCRQHLLEAHDWVDHQVGATDLLPSACLACGSRVGVRYPSGWMCAECEWVVGEVPDDELDRPRVEVVYYIRYRDQIKIGTSVNPRLRLASLPHDEVLAFERGGRALEQRRHAQFADHRFPGTEWFAVHDALLEHVAELAAGIEDPWAEYERWVLRRIALRGS